MLLYTCVLLFYSLNKVKVFFYHFIANSNFSPQTCRDECDCKHSPGNNFDEWNIMNASTHFILCPLPIHLRSLTLNELTFSLKQIFFHNVQHALELTEEQDAVFAHHRNVSINGWFCSAAPSTTARHAYATVQQQLSAIQDTVQQQLSAIQNTVQQQQ